MTLPVRPRPSTPVCWDSPRPSAPHSPSLRDLRSQKPCATRSSSALSGRAPATHSVVAASGRHRRRPVDPSPGRGRAHARGRAARPAAQARGGGSRRGRLRRSPQHCPRGSSVAGRQPHLSRAGSSREDGPYKRSTAASARPRRGAADGRSRCHLDHGRARSDGRRSGARHHRRNLAGLALDVVALIPEGSLVRLAARSRRGPPRASSRVTSVRDAIDGARKTVDAIDVVESDDGDVPAGHAGR